MSDTKQSDRRRTVRIPTADLINGWRQIIEKEVDWTCPECGGPRGEVHPAIAYDGRHQMHVDGWSNPCGHVDQYADVEREARPCSVHSMPLPLASSGDSESSDLQGDSAEDSR